MEGKKENRKRPLEEAEGESGVTQGSGIHRPLDEHIDERFERELQQERGVKILKTNAEKKHDKRLIVVLENANLELGKCLKWNKKILFYCWRFKLWVQPFKMNLAGIYDFFSWDDDLL